MDVDVVHPCNLNGYGQRRRNGDSLRVSRFYRTCRVPIRRAPGRSYMLYEFIKADVIALHDCGRWCMFWVYVESICLIHFFNENSVPSLYEDRRTAKFKEDSSHRDPRDCNGKQQTTT